MSPTRSVSLMALLLISACSAPGRSSPPHTPAVDTMPTVTGPNGSNGTLYGQHYNSWGTGGTRFAAPGSPGTGPGGFVMQPVGSQDLRSGATSGTGGGVIYDPATGSASAPGAPRPGALGSRRAASSCRSAAPSVRGSSAAS